MNSHPNLVSSANWQSRDLHSSPVIFLRDLIKFNTLNDDMKYSKNGKKVPSNSTILVGNTSLKVKILFQ